MNSPTSRQKDQAPGPRVVILVDDPAQLPIDLASFVGHLQRFAWRNGPPSIQVVAASPRPSPGSPFVERRKRATDRRQSTRLFTLDADASASTDPSPPQPLPGQRARDARHPCTDREREIIELLRRGLTNKQIAHQLGIMEETVKKHLQHIYDKLGVRRRALIMLGGAGTWMTNDQRPALP
jgi:DNA-binding CsgD family transcriptional regulator